MSKIEWHSLNGEKREWFDGMVEATFAVGNDETVSVVTHESVKDIALNYVPKREWVGLTDQDLAVFNDDVKWWAKYWESKLKVKNT